MDPSSVYEVHPITKADRKWVEEFYIRRWGSGRVVTRGKLYTVAALDGFTAWNAGARVGLITFQHLLEELEIITLDSLFPGQGTGTVLINTALDHAYKSGCRRIWLITTNDNTPALRFYQKRSFHISKLYKDAIQLSRQLKPEIPLIGLDGIPIRDEIELEIILNERNLHVRANLEES